MRSAFERSRDRPGGGLSAQPGVGAGPRLRILAGRPPSVPGAAGVGVGRLVRFRPGLLEDRAQEALVGLAGGLVGLALELDDAAQALDDLGERKETLKSRLPVTWFPMEMGNRDDE